MVNWSAIDTVLLDMDGTLLDLRYDNYFWLEYLPIRYAEHHNVSLEAATRWLQALSDSLHGTLNWYCIDHWSRAIDMDVMALKQDLTQEQARFRPGAVDFLQALHAAGKRCILVTNAHPDLLEFKLVATSLRPWLHELYSTHPFGLAKECVGFWPLFRERTGVDYSRSLFIDDSLNVLRRAAAEGLPHLLQVLQPDTTQAVRPRSEFNGIVHFTEIMPA